MIRMRTWTIALLAAVLLLAPAPLRAQMPSPPAGSPEAAATAFFAAMERQQWPEAARWVHSEALARLREVARQRARVPRAPGPTPLRPRS